MGYPTLRAIPAIYGGSALYMVVKLQLLDSMVRFSADGSKMGPTKIKKTPHPFNFLCPPDSVDISGTIGPTEMVHLSIFAGFNKEYSSNKIQRPDSKK